MTAVGEPHLRSVGYALHPVLFTRSADQTPVTNAVRAAIVQTRIHTAADRFTLTVSGRVADALHRELDRDPAAPDTTLWGWPLHVDVNAHDDVTVRVVTP